MAMLNEVKAIEGTLKQILYGCVEHVQATKAALYLSSSHDLNEKKYELVTSYQYNAADRKVVTANDDLVDRLSVKRAPFFVNGLGADQRLAEMLFRQGNDRMLATPLFSRGRLVGFIDMRDKAGRKPFELPDVNAASTIAAQMIEVLAKNKLFGLAPIVLSEAPPRTPAPSAPNVVLPTQQRPAAPPPSMAPSQKFSGDASQAVLAAREFMSKRQLHSGVHRAVGDPELEILRLRQAMAERLLEPDFQKFPELAQHSREVAVIAQRFAQTLEMPPAQVEIVRIAALVHDVGLRLLDYERLYKRLNLTAEELRGLAEHPVVGAALVEPIFGSDVAHAVLRHHERVDGKGYPSRLQGSQIPLAARIIQVADAWVAMTARQSYQQAISPDQAALRLREGAGSQFDPALVERFLRHLDRIA
jgi:HD superfamily phosphohydrolase YqeK